MSIVRGGVVLFILGALPTGAAAQSGASACKADVRQFCAKIKPGGGRLVDCLLDHQKELSDACYDALEEQTAATRGNQACRRDARQFCKGMQSGGGQLGDCLIEHQKEISNDCYDFLQKRLGSK